MTQSCSILKFSNPENPQIRKILILMAVDKDSQAVRISRLTQSCSILKFSNPENPQILKILILMAVDYDLVVIGSTPEAITAALSAAHLKARVALVEQPLEGNFTGAEAIYRRRFSQVAHLSAQLRNGGPWGLSSRETLSLDGDYFPAWTEEAIAILQEQNSPAILSAWGVDVIGGCGEFCRRPHLSFVLPHRKLRSRTYLIATGCHPAVPALPEIEKVGYLTPLDIWQKDKWASLPQQLLLVGDSPESLELAQSLRRLGKEVTLVVPSQQLLPTEDEEASRLLQGQLEAEGVKVLTASPVTQARQIGTQKWVQAGNRAIETEEIIWVSQQIPHLEGLNLAPVDVQVGKRGIRVNQKLQTTNPRIYACGGVVGGYPLTHLAQYEAKVALKNALFLPLFAVEYGSIPWAILTDPPLARVGLTEAQARRRYGEDVWVAREYYKHLAQAQILGETTGLAKLIARGNGEILGAHIVGAAAEELIGAIALARKHKVKVGALADFFPPSLTFSEIIKQTALEWQQQKFRRNRTLQYFLENFFLWRRK